MDFKIFILLCLIFGSLFGIYYYQENDGIIQKSNLSNITITPDENFNRKDNENITNNSVIEFDQNNNLTIETLNDDGGNNENNSQLILDFDEENIFEQFLDINYFFRNNVVVNKEGDYLKISPNGIPDHETGEFPNKNNPNIITEQGAVYYITLLPEFADETFYYDLSVFGIGINGVTFEPGALEYYNNDRNSGWQYDANSEGIDLGLDFNNAHVQPDGTYHYHGNPTSLVESVENDPALIGFAADGFPIYYYSNFKYASSYQLKEGVRPNGPGGLYDGTYNEDYEYIENLGDLGECNEIFAKTNEFENGIIHYVVSKRYPILPRCFVGNPHESFISKDLLLNLHQVDVPLDISPPPEDAQEVCKFSREFETCNFNNKNGECKFTPTGHFACIPN